MRAALTAHLPLTPFQQLLEDERRMREREREERQAWRAARWAERAPRTATSLRVSLGEVARIRSVGLGGPGWWRP